MLVIFILSYLIDVSNHKPRKGTETLANRYHKPKHIVSNHKPRKGTETCFIAEQIDVTFSSFKSQTPQGDGNIPEVVRVEVFKLFVSNHKPRKGTETLRPLPPSLRTGSCFKSQTPQGDGNLHKKHEHTQLGLVSNHKPRKGTETFSAPSMRRPRRWFQITNPARGRKRTHEGTRVSRRGGFKSQTPQGDGNALNSANRPSFHGFKSQTPQGDGNE